MEAKEEKEVLAITMSPSLSVERKKESLVECDGRLCVGARKKKKSLQSRRSEATDGDGCFPPLFPGFFYRLTEEPRDLVTGWPSLSGLPI